MRRGSRSNSAGLQPARFRPSVGTETILSDGRASHRITVTILKCRLAFASYKSSVIPIIHCAQRIVAVPSDRVLAFRNNKNSRNCRGAGHVEISNRHFHGRGLFRVRALCLRNGNLGHGERLAGRPKGQSPRQTNGQARKVRVISLTSHRRSTVLNVLTKIALPN
jgi:hypothetical protein